MTDRRSIQRPPLGRATERKPGFDLIAQIFNSVVVEPLLRRRNFFIGWQFRRDISRTENDAALFARFSSERMRCGLAMYGLALVGNRLYVANQDALVRLEYVVG